MKNVNQKVIILTVLILAGVSFAGTYSGGTGEPNDPYQIADANDLLTLAADTNDYHKCFILTADVNLQGQVFTTAIIAPETNLSEGIQGPAFSGGFDGNGYKIANFTINGGGNNYLGLFGVLSGSLRNLGLENFTVSGGNFVGGLVGWNSGSINNCYSKSAVISGIAYIGGLAGRNDFGSISNCHAMSEVKATNKVFEVCVGGLVGWNSGSINNCYSTGTVDDFWGGNWHVGGLVGLNESGGSISNCHSNSVVRGYSNNIGGLIGCIYSGAIITSCYATGAVSGTGSGGVGGLVGESWGGNYINCYSTGAVTSSGSSIGGLVGNGWGGSIINCYSTGAVGNSPIRVGGLVGWSRWASAQSNLY